MSTDSTAFVTFLGTQVGYAWAWILGVVGALFVYALATGLLKRAIRAVLRHARGLGSV